MSDLVVNPEDWFRRIAAHMMYLPYTVYNIPEYCVFGYERGTVI